MGTTGSAVLGQLLVLAGLVALLAFMLRSMRPASGRGRYGAKRWADLARYTPPENRLGWVAPLMGVLAVAELAGLGGVSAGATTGVVIGAVSGVVPRAARPIWHGVLSVVGVLAALHVAVKFLDGTACGPDQAVVRATALAATAGVFVLGAVIGVLGNSPRWSWSLGLSAFAAVEALVVISSPLGASTSGFSWLLQAVAALGFGLLVGLLPAVGLTLAAPALSLVVLVEGDLLGSACALPGSASGTTMIVSFGVAYVVTSWVRRALFH